MTLLSSFEHFWFVWHRCGVFIVLLSRLFFFESAHICKDLQKSCRSAQVRKDRKPGFLARFLKVAVWNVINRAEADRLHHWNVTDMNSPKTRVLLDRWMPESEKTTEFCHFCSSRKPKTSISSAWVMREGVHSSGTEVDLVIAV